MKSSRPYVLAAVLLVLFCAGRAAGQTDDWLKARAVAEPAQVPAGGNFRIVVTLDIAPGYHINAREMAQNPPEVVPQPQDGLTFGTARYPPGVAEALEWSGTEIQIYKGRVAITVPVSASADAAIGKREMALDLKYQGCSEEACFAPATRRLTATVEILPASAQAVGIEPPEETYERTELEAAWQIGFVTYLLALFLGGLALNLTPCVFPMIPITMTFFSQQGVGGRRRVLLLAIIFVLGLAAAFTALGVLAAMAGKPLGLVLQRPWGVLVVCIVLAALMANAFGMFEIRLPGRISSLFGGRAGAAGAFVMGLLMGVVASPCVGAFLAALITFVASKKSVTFGAVSFFALGLGLGMPYLVLGTFTGLISRWPRGGAWMPWAKKVLGLSVLALIVWFLHPYIKSEMLWPMVLALAVLAGIYIGFIEGRQNRPWSRGFWVARLVAMVVIIAAGAALYAWGTSERPAVRWSEWTPGSLESAREAGRPAMLFFTADLCPACERWKQRVFADTDVIAESDRFERLMINLTTATGSEAAELAEKYAAQNPPLVILFDPSGKMVGNPLRKVPAPEEFLKVMDKAAARTEPDN